MSYDENRISDLIDGGLIELKEKEDILDKVYNHIDSNNLWMDYDVIIPLHFRYACMSNIITWDEYEFYFDLNKTSVYSSININK